jgi:hypothetical protein
LISRLRYGRAWDEWDEGRRDSDDVAAGASTPQVQAVKPRSRRRRLLVTLAFATLFVAGAAFSATAGDQVRSVLEAQAASDATGAEDATTTETTEPASTDPAPAADSAAADSGSASAEAPAESSAPAAPSEQGAEPEAAPSEAAAPAQSAPVISAAAKNVVQRVAIRSGSVKRAAKPHKRRASHRVFMRTMRAKVRRHHFPKRAHKKGPAVEMEGAASAVVYLNRALPDPTPPALRLSPVFARHLQAVARSRHADWALMLGVLRAEGHNGSAPADFAGLRSVASRLSLLGARDGGPWAAMFSLSGNPSFSERAVALAHYYRAVGIRALVNGLLVEKSGLAQKVLNDRRVSIYAGGRGDIESGRVNVRVLALIEYLADSFNQVTVSCLISGHRLYARPGVISAHIYGLAADISEVGGTSVTGHQQAGSVTARAVRDMLLLPPELMPKQIISLLGLGGPSFPLANHYDHIHIGY